MERTMKVLTLVYPIHNLILITSFTILVETYILLGITSNP